MVKWLYSASGFPIAFIQNEMVYNPYGQSIGQIFNGEIFTESYVGEIVDGDLFLINDSHVTCPPKTSPAERL